MPAISILPADPGKGKTINQGTLIRTINYWLK